MELAAFAHSKIDSMVVMPFSGSSRAGHWVRTTRWRSASGTLAEMLVIPGAALATLAHPPASSPAATPALAAAAAAA